MSNNPIRVAMAAISGRIFAGRPTKDGRGFKEPRYDVTGDVFAAIRDFVGVGNEIEVGLPGTAVEFRIAVLPPFTTPSQRLDAATVERCAQVADANAATSVPLMNGLGVAACIEQGRHRAGTEIAKQIRTLATEPHQHGGKA